MSADELDALAGGLGINFRRRELLEQALVHRSYLNENPDFPLADNERLEFLGDAVIGFLTADYLYGAGPPLSEGEMTTVRAALVRADSLARWARTLDLGRHLRLGKGEVASGGRTRRGLLASAFEALVAAIYLDQGLDVARAFLLRFVVPETARLLAQQSAKDFKSRLQEAVQAAHQATPVYRTVETLGPDHERTFIVEVLADDKVLARGSGPSKQEAEQDAARTALALLAGARTSN